MALTETTLRMLGPADDEEVTIRMNGELARDFVAMLNMNKIRNHRGELVIFEWRQWDDGEWYLTERLHIG